MVVNTHANGDHCWGNQLVRDCRDHGRAAAPRRWPSSRPRCSRGSWPQPPEGPTGDLLRRMFGAFDFSDIELVPPTTIFDGELTLRVGGTEVRLIEVGPAHTRGDVIAHLPAHRVVFTGDILFNGGHPIVWAGPVANWVAACDRIVELAPETVVPGHGPVCDTAAVASAASTSPSSSAGAAPGQRRADPAQTPPATSTSAGTPGWGKDERFVSSTAAVSDLGHDVPGDAASMLGEMATYGSG